MSHGLYERAVQDAAPPPLHPPRASASVVLWRRRGGELEVYWVERAPELAFMGGWRAFPGGAVARRDANVPVQSEPQGSAEAPPAGGMPEGFRGATELAPLLAPGLIAAALRELFEETGILLTDGDLPAAERRRWRRRLLAGDAAMGDLLAERGVALEGGELVYAGRWLTPPLGPLRFDNRFFLLEWTQQRMPEPEIVGGELVSGEWIAPGRAVELCREGRALAAPPIVHHLQVLHEMGPSDGLERLRDAEEANLGPYRRIEFRPGFLLFPLPTRTLPPAVSTNCFLLGGGTGVLLDPGTGDPAELERLGHGLAAAESRLGRRPGAIWVSHHHPDHVGGVEALRRRLEIPVAAHPETARRLEQRGIGVDRHLRDGECVELDGDPPLRLRVLHTPGHAPGHLAFFDEVGGTLLAGDLVSGVSTIVIDPPEGRMSEYLESLARVAALEPRTLLPAHGPAMARPSAALEAARDHRLWREERVLAAWRRGITEPAAMLPTVYDDVPESVWPLAERQIVAHLEHLRETGRAE